MMTAKQNRDIASKRLSRNFSKYFLYFLFFSAITAVATIAINIINQVFINKYGYDLNEIVFADIFGDNIPILTKELVSLATVLLEVTSIISLVLSVLNAALFSVPKAAVFLGLVNGTPVSLKESFSRIKGSVKVALLMEVKVFLWSLLFIVPGIIKAFSYSQAYFIKEENPDLSANECLQKSSEMMMGKKFKLFCLYLSYIGWFILVGIAIYFVNLITENILLYTKLQSVLKIGSHLLWVLINTAAMFVAEALVGAKLATSEAVFYVDVKRSYLEDIEVRMRFDRENGREINSNGDVFSEKSNDDENVFEAKEYNESNDYLRKSDKDDKTDDDPFV